MILSWDGEKTKWFTLHITVVIISVVTLLYGIELSNSFLIGQKRTVNFRNQHPWRHNRRYYNNHGKDTQGHGQSCHVWPQCMISKGNLVSFAWFVLLAVCEEAETWLPSFCVQCVIKQLLGSVFVIPRVIKVSVRVISLNLRLQLITPTSTLITLDITKTSSNNCF